jgi:hypothetical protein
MYMLVGVLAIAHAVSLVIKFAGQQIYEAFQDDDKDGIPNIIDRKDNRKPQPQMKVYASEDEAPKV